jgi:hypothetical protein
MGLCRTKDDVKKWKEWMMNDNGKKAWFGRNGRGHWGGRTWQGRLILVILVVVIVAAIIVITRLAQGT